MSEPAESDIGQYCQRLVEDLDLRKTRQEAAEEDLELDSREVMSDAVMQPGTEGHRSSDIGACQIQSFRGGKDLRIHVRGQYPKKHDIAFAHRLAAELKVLGSDSRLCRRHADMARHLLHGGQRVALAAQKKLHLFRIVCPRVQAEDHGIDGGLVSRGEQDMTQPEHFILRESPCRIVG